MEGSAEFHTSEDEKNLNDLKCKVIAYISSQASDDNTLFEVKYFEGKSYRELPLNKYRFRGNIYSAILAFNKLLITKGISDGLFHDLLDIEFEFYDNVDACKHGIIDLIHDFKSLKKSGFKNYVNSLTCTNNTTVHELCDLCISWLNERLVDASSASNEYLKALLIIRCFKQGTQVENIANEFVSNLVTNDTLWFEYSDNVEIISWNSPL